MTNAEFIKSKIAEMTVEELAAYLEDPITAEGLDGLVCRRCKACNGKCPKMLPTGMFDESIECMEVEEWLALEYDGWMW